MQQVVLPWLQKKYSLCFVAFLCGSVLGLSFNYPVLWFFGLCSFIPFFYVIFDHGVNPKKVFWAGWIFGSTFLGLAYVPIWHTLPIDWLGVHEPTLSLILVFMYWGSFVFTFAIWNGGLWALTIYLFKNKTCFYSIIWWALSWVVFEYIRMWWFAILMAGNGSLIKPYFSTGFVGYLLGANDTLLQFASVGGVYLLSFLVVFINGFLYWLLFCAKWNARNTRYKHSIIFVGFFIFIAAVSLPVLKEKNENATGDADSIRVALVQTWFPAQLQLSRADERNHLQILRSITENMAVQKTKPNIIIYPEDSRFSSWLGQNEWWTMFDTLFKDAKPFVVDSGRVHDADDKTRSRLFYFNVKDRSLETTDKNFFVPVGEYIPYFYKSFLAILNQDDLIQKLIYNRSYSAGGKAVLGTYKDVGVGGVFCSEILSPSLTGQRVRSGANILVNVSASAWFHGSRILHNQQINVLKVRAVENNRYIVRSANFSPAFAVDNKGRLIGEMPWGETGVLRISVQPIAEQSIYNNILGLFHN